MTTFHPVRADVEPARTLMAAMEAELVELYGDFAGRNAPTATPDELWLPGGTYLVGLDDDATAVTGGGFKRLAPDLCEIKRMYVVPAARGRGLAGQLLAALEDAARGLGYPRVRLDTGPKQPHARRLYERSGYVAIPDYNGNHAASFWGEKRL